MCVIDLKKAYKQKVLQGKNLYRSSTHPRMDNELNVNQTRLFLEKLRGEDQVKARFVCHAWDSITMEIVHNRRNDFLEKYMREADLLSLWYSPRTSQGIIAKMLSLAPEAHKVAIVRMATCQKILKLQVPSIDLYRAIADHGPQDFDWNLSVPERGDEFKFRVACDVVTNIAARGDIPMMTRLCEANNWNGSLVYDVMEIALCKDNNMEFFDWILPIYKKSMIGPNGVFGSDGICLAANSSDAIAKIDRIIEDFHLGAAHVTEQYAYGSRRALLHGHIAVFNELVRRLTPAVAWNFISNDLGRFVQSVYMSGSMETLVAFREFIGKTMFDEVRSIPNINGGDYRSVYFGGNFEMFKWAMQNGTLGLGNGEFLTREATRGHSLSEYRSFLEYYINVAHGNLANICGFPNTGVRNVAEDTWGIPALTKMFIDCKVTLSIVVDLLEKYNMAETLQKLLDDYPQALDKFGSKVWACHMLEADCAMVILPVLRRKGLINQKSIDAMYYDAVVYNKLETIKYIYEFAQQCNLPLTLARGPVIGVELITESSSFRAIIETIDSSAYNNADLISIYSLLRTYLAGNGDTEISNLLSSRLEEILAKYGPAIAIEHGDVWIRCRLRSKTDK